MVAAMDAVGVDGAILVSPYAMYRYDASYALEVHKAYPRRLGLVKPVDPTDPKVAETIAGWKKTTGTGALRIMVAPAPARGPPAPARRIRRTPASIGCWPRPPGTASRSICSAGPAWSR